MGSGRSTPTSALPLAAALAAGGVVLAAAGYFGCSAYDRTISRRKAERLARPWLSKDAGNRIATVDSAAAALAAMTSSSTSSSSSSSSSRASALVVVADLSDKGLRSFELTELAGVTSADLSGNEGLDLATVDSLPPPPLSRLLLLLLPSPLWPSRPSLASLRSLGLSRCALRSVPRGLAGACPNLSDLDLSHNELEGAFKTVGESLEATLTKLGLEPFGATDEAFDPMVHEALTTESRAEITEPTVISVYQSGYRFAGRVLRPARVAVAGTD